MQKNCNNYDIDETTEQNAGPDRQKKAKFDAVGSDHKNTFSSDDEKGHFRARILNIEKKCLINVADKLNYYNLNFENYYNLNFENLSFKNTNL